MGVTAAAGAGAGGVHTGAVGMGVTAAAGAGAGMVAGTVDGLTLFVWCMVWPTLVAVWVVDVLTGCADDIWVKAKVITPIPATPRVATPASSFGAFRNPARVPGVFVVPLDFIVFSPLLLIGYGGLRLDDLEGIARCRFRLRWHHGQFARGGLGR
jgi:hypothetical protein